MNMGDKPSKVNLFTKSSKSKKTTGQKIQTHYKMTHKCIGRALIFNHENFLDSENPPRRGTDKDRHKMKTTLQSFGFIVTVCEDYNRDSIEKKLDDVAKENHKNNDCFVLVLMTHGELGFVEAYDKRYPVEILWQPFTAARCPSLADKPKLFFIQACRGSSMDDGHTLHEPFGDPNGNSIKPSLATVDANPIELRPSFMLPMGFYEPDFLICYSTPPGYYSWRTPSKGS